jgi:pimeloyl-ACP methyl ester carboxylesterase
MSSSPRVVIPGLARGAFGAVQAVSSPLAARLAERWFFMPPRKALPREARAFLRSGRRFTLRVDGRTVVGWTWGVGPAVYLVHGWGGRAGRLSALAGSLIEGGHRVVMFDAPGHGESGHGLSSLPEFARALQAVVDLHGPARAVVAHSFGAAAATLATRWGLAAERFVLLAPAADPAAFANDFAVALGARPEVMARMRARSERRLRFSWTELDVRGAAARMTAPVLVVHDETDDVVPFTEGAAIAASWPGARLFATTGLGHRGVVRDPRIIDEVVRFVHARRRSRPQLAEVAQLEYELFYRESRSPASREPARP